MILLLITAGFDFAIEPKNLFPMGSCAIFVAAYFSICCGISMTYIEASVGLLLVTAMAVCKITLLATSSTYAHPILSGVIYGVPILMNAVIIWGLIYPNDALRRIRFLKSFCIETQLAQMKQERQKTDYLLSLSLPKSIVNRLRDQPQFGLIVNRYTDSKLCDYC